MGALRSRCGGLFINASSLSSEFRLRSQTSGEYSNQLNRKVKEGSERSFWSWSEFYSSCPFCGGLGRHSRCWMLHFYPLGWTEWLDHVATFEAEGLHTQIRTNLAIFVSKKTQKFGSIRPNFPPLQYIFDPMEQISLDHLWPLLHLHKLYNTPWAYTNNKKQSSQLFNPYAVL